MYSLDIRIKNAIIARAFANDMLEEAINEKLAFFKMNPPNFREFVEWYIGVGEPLLSRFSGLLFTMDLPENPVGIVTPKNKIAVARIVHAIKPEWKLKECLDWVAATLAPKNFEPDCYRSDPTDEDRGTSTSGQDGKSISGDDGTSTSGNGGTSTSGDRGTSTSGKDGTSISGDDGISTSGYHGISTSGHCGTSTSGYGGISTSGCAGISTSGDRGTSISGDYGTSTSGNGGTSISGDRGTSTSGYGGTAKSGIGGILQIKWDDSTRYRIATAYVGENGIEPNVAYRVDNEGRFYKCAKQ